MERSLLERKIGEISKVYAAVNQKLEEFVVGNKPWSTLCLSAF